MRIIAGSAKGRNLRSPIGETARPTSDRAREALFSSLESEFGDVEGISFLDLFAGSGAVAAEALSRGAVRVLAVEGDRENAEVAQSNLDMVAETSDTRKSEVRSMTVERYLAGVDAVKPFDVVFLDPPYEHSNSSIKEIVETLIQKKLLHERSLVVIERESKSGFTWPSAMREVKVRRYGHSSMHYGELISG